MGLGIIFVFNSLVSNVAFGQEFSCANPPVNSIFCDDFETGNLNKWDEITTPYSVTSNKQFVKSGNFALDGRIDSNGGGRLGKWYMPGYDEIYVRFDMLIEPGFQNLRSDGSGMHFVAHMGNHVNNMYSASGQAGVKPNGTDYFYAGLDPYQVFNDPTLRPFVFYTSYPDMNCPSALCYGINFQQTAPQVSPTPGSWQEVVFGVRLNTVGLKDGFQTLYLPVNGVLTKKIDITGMRWRDTTNIRLNQFVFNNYMPGAPKAQHIWIDNLVITTTFPAGTPNTSAPAAPKNLKVN